jgi:hypothetical protein
MAQQPIEWKETLHRVRQITDGRGMPVDPGIDETVAILQLMGLHTTMSCAGHADRVTEGPYVMFLSPEAEKYREQCKKIKDPKDVEYKKLLQKARVCILSDMKALYDKLESFYQSRAGQSRAYLVLKSTGFSRARLDCQGAELAHILDQASRLRLLEENQMKMREFTEYLKKEVFHF